MGEFVSPEPVSVGHPGSLPLDDDGWFGTAEVFPEPSAVPEIENAPVIGRPVRMRLLGIPEIEPLPPTGPITIVRDDQRPEELTGPMAPLLLDEGLTGPLAVVEAPEAPAPAEAPADTEVDEPHTE
ncbi:hypothetical protein I4I73_18525, partial [Pseudonocardia sp. KRD-184]